MPFDEIYAQGAVRSTYRKQLLALEKVPGPVRALSLKAANRMVQGDASFLPLVRVIPSAEYKLLSAGVKQRGLALRMFLADHFHGPRSYEAAGIVSAAEVNWIKSRYNPFPPLREQNIQFWYAPDIIRTANGSFRVMEDNLGFVGGIGDLEALAAASSALGMPLIPSRSPKYFYEALLKRYGAEARKAGGGKVILLSHSQPQRANKEDGRLLAAFGKDVTMVTNFRSLALRENGLFHRGERVGFVIVNMGGEDIEPLRPTPYRIRNFWNAAGSGLFGVSYSPGFEFVSDKQLCGKVDAMIRHYLKEDCLLPSLPTICLRTERSRRKVFQQKAKWVIKACRGQGGSSVFVGPHLSDSAWRKLKIRLERDPHSFVAQKYAQPSQFLGRDVDFRPIADVSPAGVRVSPILWGRAAKDKRHKTNIARGGFLAPVIVVGN
jgi:hypothetical protein